MRGHFVTSLAAATVGLGIAGCANVEVVDPAAGGGGSGTGGGGSPATHAYELAFVMGDYDAASNSVSDCRVHVLDLEDPTLTSRVVGDARPLADFHGEGPRWSPDGTMLSYTDEDGRGHLVRLDPSGATDELLSQDPPGNDVDTATLWSPDSTRVATYQTGGSASDGLLVDVSQSPPEIVAHLGAFGGSPPLGFSPTGDRFAFTRDSGLFVVDTLSASPTPERLATGIASAWSIDGSHLFFSTEDGLFWVAADGSSGPDQLAIGPVHPRVLVFPDDAGIVFQSGDGVSTSAEVVFVDLTEVPPTQRSLSGPHEPSASIWMAGSTMGQLAYTVEGLPFLFAGSSAPPVPIELPASVAGDCDSLFWSPDGRWLAVNCTATNGDRVTVLVDSTDPAATPTPSPLAARCGAFSHDSTGLLCRRSTPDVAFELRWHPLAGGTGVTIAMPREDSFLGWSELISMAFRPGSHDLAYHMDRLHILEDDPPASNELLLFEPELAASRVLATGLCHDRISWRPTAPSPAAR